ncbi:hypothetical protein [Marilutibacter alkalisoli]|uniref:Anti-sigma factor n=1 Tax=Marilutibacter alkalisoli TaxID=2591633 RepID=A0A514BNT8_9GAMM|nr:hypothetical protein [Lysobacter alkalisoli]QDH68995.1 hypothetical protein FKV23_01920 [Lysobacter alkalisoli]
MKIDDEMLMAHADGELAPADAARVEAAIAADPALAAKVERHRALRSRLTAAFADVSDEPVPERLLAAARGEAAMAGGVADIRDAAGRREVRIRRQWSWPQWGAMAASLLLGMLVAQWFHARDDRGGSGVLMADAGGQLQAHGRLVEALDVRLASAPGADDDISIGISFRDTDGRYCRSFALQGARVQAGLACRDDAGWHVPVLEETDAMPTGELRLASTPLPAAVLAAVDARIDGEPLDAEGERAARAAGWR